MNLLQIVMSLFASFFGVQSEEKLKRDEEYIEKHGIKYYIIVGFFLVFCLILILLGIVKLVVHLAQ